MQDHIFIKGARENNLKNIDVTIPRDKLVVLTGLSGSGKSSLAFDTIYAEGQRRYVESLSSYARMFLGQMDKPDALEIPQAAIDAAKAQGGTVSELYGVTNGGAEAGYVAKVAASGSQGTITMMVGIDANGAITGISVVSHSETSGIGTKVVENKPNAAGTPVLDQFIGMSGAGTLAVGSNITAISGATVSTKGITMGANAALAAVEALG